MILTQILYPLDGDTSQTIVRNRKDLWKDTKIKRNDLKELDVSECEYILAVRSSLNCPAIFIKRSPNELR